MFFHKKELCLTSSMRAKHAISEILNTNQIRYDVSYIDQVRYDRTYMVRQGYKGVSVFKFEVHKKDYEQAQYLIRMIRLTD